MKAVRPVEELPLKIVYPALIYQIKLTWPMLTKMKALVGIVPLYNLWIKLITFVRINVQVIYLLVLTNNTVSLHAPKISIHSITTAQTLNLLALIA